MTALAALLLLFVAGSALGVRLDIRDWVKMTGLGGVWFPLKSGALHHIGRAPPSYRLVQASHVAVGGQGWGKTGWLVVAGWSVVPSVLARRAYRRDTARV